jgi:acetylornithine/succinyldiaminopimelate/putrescine aminotransferase
LARSHVQKNLRFGTWLSPRSRALTIRGEKLANILLLASSHQEVSMGRDNTLRLSPALIITRDQCDFALVTLEECLTLAVRED